MSFAPTFERSGLSLERLRSFLIVAEAGGMALAAPKSPARQSLYSRQIGELEAALEVALLERKGRGVTLTDAGRRLATTVRELVRGLDEVAHRAEASPPIALGAGDSLLHWWVLPRLARVDLPSQLSVVALASDDVLRRLDEVRLDFGLVRASQVPPGFGSRKLGAIAYALYAPRAWRKRWSDGLALVRGAPLALQSSEPELSAKLLALAGRRGGGAGVLLCETFPQVQRALASGRFAGVLPTLARAELPSTVEEIDVPGYARPSFALRLVWRRRTLDRRADGERLIRLLAEALTLHDP